MTMATSGRTSLTSTTWSSRSRPHRNKADWQRRACRRTMIVRRQCFVACEGDEQPASNRKLKPPGVPSAAAIATDMKDKTILMPAYDFKPLLGGVANYGLELA